MPATAVVQLVQASQKIVKKRRFGAISTVPSLIRQLCSTMVLQAAGTVDTVQLISLRLLRALMKWNPGAREVGLSVHFESRP